MNIRGTIPTLKLRGELEMHVVHVAYIDPGTGSYYIQVLAGIALGAAVTVKMFWKRIWAFVTRRPVKDRSTRGE